MDTDTTLVDLPSELVILIMTFLDNVQVLQNLAQTCRHLRQIYNEKRRDIIGAILDDMINLQCGVAIEAERCEAAFDARTLGELRFDDRLLLFLDIYRTRRAEQLKLDQTFQKPERTVFYTGRGLRDFQIRAIKRRSLGVWPALDSQLSYLQKLHDRHMMIRQCVDRFCHEVLTTKSSQDLSEEDRKTRLKPLSPTERRRLYRAFYRVELYHQIYHDLRRQGGDSEGVVQVRDHIWLCTFPPHECEEIATVYQWLDDRCRTRFETIDQDLATWKHRQTYVDEGLARCLDAMTEEDLPQLVLFSERCRAKPVEELHYLGTCLVTKSPFHDAFGPMAAQDGYPAESTPLVFDHDHPDCPNYGWLWSHKFNMTGVIHHYSQADLRQIGHVMWDEPRLKTWDTYQASPPRLDRLNWNREDDSWWNVPGVDGSGPYSSDDDDDDDEDYAS